MNQDVIVDMVAMDYQGREVEPKLPRAMLPAGSHCVEFHSSAINLEKYYTLDPVEQDIVADAVDLRKADFGDSRWCAHEAMKPLIEDQPILRGPRGMPLFPEGVVGSITHTESFRAAIVGRSSRWRSLGIDAEPARPLPEGVFNSIARPEEQRRLRRTARTAGFDMIDAHWDTVLFSAKEATYKAWFPLTKRYLDFDQADIDIRADGTFTSYLLVSPVPVPFIQGRWTISGGHVLTVAAVPQR